ncbi:MAG TPA: PSD1 and planctomycete cytochrome C domain-containing protein [Candidatus Limnocylindria bacterium]|nr:PSD1 and planctomycete cytochrome C domain-containing protein [Candidatus Limnocylindria bacterium]
MVAEFQRGLVLLGLALVLGADAGAVTVRKVDFNHDVQPLLSDNCFACHGPDTNKIKGKLRLDLREVATRPAKSGKVAIIPGKPEESELMRRLLTADEDDHMPPAESHKTLSPAQQDLLRRWIAEGAEYKGHWSYTLPVKPAVAAGSKGIDQLVRKRLTEAGLTPAAPADRRTLARRLYSDLVGLPPTPGEVAAFEQDTSPEAYDRLVERLLSSPHYGERMAIGWLDVVRFADTIGYHSDTPRNIWPYRDYVIRAFNEDKPFDQFTREQLAGDLLPHPTQEQEVASAFNRLLLTTEEGGAQPKDYEARYLTDRVRAIGAVWLGQTIGCAQCHDHKFDPITQRDFDAMGAVFADVKEAIIGAREPGRLVPDEDQQRALTRHEAAVKGLQQEIDGPHPELAAAFAGWQEAEQARLAEEARWSPIAPAKASSANGAKLSIRDDRSVLAGGKNPDTETYTLRFTNALAGVVGLRLEVLPDDSLPEKGPGRAANGNFVLTEVVGRIERAGAEPRTIRFQSARASHEQSTLAEGNPYHAWSAAATIDGDVKGTSPGWAVLPETGRPQQLRLELKEPLTLEAGETLVIELQQKHGDSGHNLGCFRLATTTEAKALGAPFAPPLGAELAELLQVPAATRNAEQQHRLFVQFKDQAPELAALRQRLAEAKKAREDFVASVPRCLVTERNDEPRTVRILPRGNFLIETGDKVEPALPAFLVKNGGRTEGHRVNRLDLANWLVARDNPLTARVVMNRLWRQFFGLGLSKVLDDLGAQGEPPPNQALLDWLACEFMDSGWDLKRMVRLLVLSDTYRQSSTVPHDLLVRDPENRLLGRQGRWRVEAELVRDNALSLAGLLVPAVGGPSVRPYQPEGYWENLNFPVRTYEASRGGDQYRRGLYAWWQRSYVQPSLLAFDAPTREECAAERNRSNIPQQALVLLNDPTYVEAARGLATRILRECPGDAAARITWAWRQALARAPRPEELATLQALLDKHLAEFRQNREAVKDYLKVGFAPAPAELDPAELAAWTDVARALLNLHETVTRS